MNELIGRCFKGTKDYGSHNEFIAMSYFPSNDSYNGRDESFNAVNHHSDTLKELYIEIHPLEMFESLSEYGQFLIDAEERG